MTARASGGFTYLEVLLATALLAATMATMGYAVASSSDLADQQQRAAQARYLLQDGIAWVRSLARVDPSDASSFGREAGEATLADVDDVDDLAGVVETAPADRAGKFAGTDWQRTWTVVSADLTDPATSVGNGTTPLLRVAITISHQGLSVADETLLLSRTP